MSRDINIQKMSESLRQEFQMAWQSTLERGNLYPLVEFYSRNELQLKRYYGLSINDVLGMTPDTLDKISAVGTKAEKKSVATNPLSSLLIDERQSPTQMALPILAVGLALGGAYLIFKSF